MNIPQGPFYIDDTFTFSVTTHRFDTGVLTDADSVPAFRVYEDETGTAILNGNMAKLDDGNTTGFYSEQLTLSAANGFEVGKSYSIYVTATVNSVAGGVSGGFKVSGNHPVAVQSIANNAITAASIATDAIDADALAANAVTEIQSGLATAAALDTVDNFLDTEIAALTTAVDTIDNFLDTEVAAILAAVDTEVAAIKTVTDQLVAAHSEPTGVPAADETPLDKLGYLFMALRNRVDVTDSKKTFYDDGGAAEWEKDLSDDGTTYTETEANAI